MLSLSCSDPNEELTIFRNNLGEFKKVLKAVNCEFVTVGIKSSQEGDSQSYRAETLTTS